METNVYKYRWNRSLDDKIYEHLLVDGMSA